MITKKHFHPRELTYSNSKFVSAIKNTAGIIKGSFRISRSTIAYLLLSVIFVYVSTTTEIAFDRDYLDRGLSNYREQKTSLWKHFANLVFDSAIGFDVFYFGTSVIFVSCLLAIIFLDPFNDKLITAAYYAFAILWWGFGQMRYGTAVMIFGYGMIRQSKHITKIAFLLIAVYYHRILLIGLPVLVVFSFLNSKSANFLVITIITIALLFQTEEWVILGLNIFQYEEYINWVDLERTGTWIKTLFIASSLIWSCNKNELLRSKLIAMGLLFLAFALYPVSAGRSYHLLLGCIVPIAVQKIGNLKTASKLALVFGYMFEVISILASPYFFGDSNLE